MKKRKKNKKIKIKKLIHGFKQLPAPRPENSLKESINPDFLTLDLKKRGEIMNTDSGHEPYEI